jgi:hypothetical protein
MSPSEPFRLGASAVACTRLMRCATNSGADRDLLTAISRQLQRAGDKQPACCNRRALPSCAPALEAAAMAMAMALGIRPASAAPFPFHART